jgi:hypothetical protein
MDLCLVRLADYASDRMKNGTKGATVRRDLATLSCLCSCAAAWDYIDANSVKQFSKRHTLKLLRWQHGSSGSLPRPE